MRGPLAIGLALAGAVLVGVLGYWVENQPGLRRLRRRLQPLVVPRPLLDTGQLGSLLQRGDLVQTVPNDGRLYRSGRRLDDDEPLLFRRKSRVGPLLYRANPARRPTFPDSTLPPEAEIPRDWMVVSLAVDEEDLHGEAGIVTNWVERYERRSHVSVYVEGERVFASRAGIRLHGGASRRPGQDKSFRILLRDRYGALEFPSDLLFEGRMDPVRTLILRRPEGFDSSFSYDLGRALGNPVPETQPALLYLNGILRGPYDLTEHLGRRQMRSRFGHEDFLVYRIRGITGDAGFQAMQRLNSWALDLAGPDMAQEVAHYVDLARFSRYLLTVAFCGTNDWEQGAAVLDLTDPESRWTWIHWDMDRGFKDRHVANNWEKPAISLLLDESLQSQKSLLSLLFVTLIEGDPDYRESFVRLTTDVLNHVWTPEFLEAANARYAVTLEYSGEKEALRLEDRERFLRYRPAILRMELRERFGLGPLVSCRVRAADGRRLAIEVDGYERETPYEGTYFAGQTVRVRLSDSETGGARHWRVDGRSHPRGPLEVELTGNTTILAVFGD